MKHLLLSLLLTVAFAGCNDSGKTSFENGKQQQFDDLLSRWRTKEFEQKNELQKKELYSDFDNALHKYLDTNKVFVNWKGTVKDIKSNTIEGATTIQCTIYYQPEEYRKITFNCSFTVKDSSKAKNQLYNKLKLLANDSQVYFDGFVARSVDKQVVYDGERNNELVISYPDYKFNLLDISPEKRRDSLSVNLSHVVDVNFKVFDLLEKKVAKQITAKEWSERTKSLGLDNLDKNLTVEENAYSTRLKQYLYSDFLSR